MVMITAFELLFTGNQRGFYSGFFLETPTYTHTHTQINNQVKVHNTVTWPKRKVFGTKNSKCSSGPITL